MCLSLHVADIDRGAKIQVQIEVCINRKIVLEKLSGIGQYRMVHLMASQLVTTKLIILHENEPYPNIQLNLSQVNKQNQKKINENEKSQTTETFVIIAFEQYFQLLLSGDAYTGIIFLKNIWHTTELKCQKNAETVMKQWNHIKLLCLSLYVTGTDRSVDMYIFFAVNKQFSPDELSRCTYRNSGWESLG